jgi:signal transduction histidine kinase
VAASEELLDRTDRATASASASQPAVRDMCDIVESSHHMLALINDVLDFE